MTGSTLLTVLLAAFGGAIAEVGAIMVVGGNIRGATRTMTTTIALETSRGDLPLALAVPSKTPRRDALRAQPFVTVRRSPAAAAPPAP